jgi:hypothetical protein
MQIQYIAIMVYLLVGFVLSYYWFIRDYEKEYKKSIEDGEAEEKGMFSLVMLLMTVLWPFILTKNLIIHKTL